MPAQPLDPNYQPPQGATLDDDGFWRLPDGNYAPGQDDAGRIFRTRLMGAENNQRFEDLQPRFDPQRNLQYIMRDGQRYYLQPAGSRAPSGGVLHQDAVWNPQTGQWDEGGLDWGNIATIGIGGAIAAPVALAAAGGGGGAAAGGAGAVTGGAETGGVLGSTAIGSGYTTLAPALEGGFGMGGAAAAGAGGATAAGSQLATLGSTQTVPTAGTLPAGATSGTGMGAGAGSGEFMIDPSNISDGGMTPGQAINYGQRIAQLYNQIAHNGQSTTDVGSVAANRADQAARNRFLEAGLNSAGTQADRTALGNSLRAGYIANYAGPTGPDRFGRPSLAPSADARAFATRMGSELRRRADAGEPLTMSGVRPPTAQELADEEAARQASNGRYPGGTASNLGNYINEGAQLARLGWDIYSSF